MFNFCIDCKSFEECTPDEILSRLKPSIGQDKCGKEGKYWQARPEEKIEEQTTKKGWWKLWN